MNEIEKEIFRLEEVLQSEESRKNLLVLGELLADDFLEFGTSGKIFSKKEILESLPQEKGKFKYIMSDFSLKEISENILQAIYKTERTENEIEKVFSLRSSLWRKEGGKWKMFFHQATRINS